jgi:hypothetical protein
MRHGNKGKSCENTSKLKRTARRSEEAPNYRSGNALDCPQVELTNELPIPKFSEEKHFQAR